MDKLLTLLEDILNSDLEWVILSQPRSGENASKVKIRPILIKEDLMFQETVYRGTQVFHTNYLKDEAIERIIRYLQDSFQQAGIRSRLESAAIRVSKKGQITIKRNMTASKDKETGKIIQKNALTHNRVKHYILEEGKPVPFLIRLGVQTKEGMIVRSKYDKFRQINRFLEFIEDVVKELPVDREIRIIDFGCGKSYLTFAMYYFFHELKGREVQIVGLDLKEDVIRHCRSLAEEFGYTGLHFEKGDISSYKGGTNSENSNSENTNSDNINSDNTNIGDVDMVVSLHACDTATDYALEKAVRWNARVILAVPCCQHEVNGQISNDMLAPFLKYGLIRERMSALITDAVRAELLEEYGYESQILDFIDMEHTPKNILIRAVKRKGMRPGKSYNSKERHTLEKTLECLSIHPTLRQLLKTRSLTKVSKDAT